MAEAPEVPVAPAVPIVAEVPVAPAEPVARSAVAPAPPTSVVAGWEVSVRRSTAALQLADASPLTKVGVRAAGAGERLAAGSWEARRDGHGALVAGAAPGEWLVLAAPGTAAEVTARLAESLAGATGLVSLVDLTHGRALLRLTGPAASAVLAKICAVDLSERVTPNGAALRTSVAQLATDIVRDDVDGVPSYLLHCERSSGQNLFDVLLDAGAEFDIDTAGVLRKDGQAWDFLPT